MSAFEFGILNDRELDALASSSGDDCDMAAVECVVREVRKIRADLARCIESRRNEANIQQALVKQRHEAVQRLNKVTALAIEACDIASDAALIGDARSRLSAIRLSITGEGGE